MLDGQNLGAEVTSPPYQLVWDTRTAPDGTRTLTAVARDAAGNVAVSPAVSVTVDNPPGIPRGIFSSTPAGDPVPSDVLANPLIEGVTIRAPWPTIELAEGVYDWSYLDTEIARAAAAGKQILLRVPSGGLNTPQWVFDAGVQTFSFVDDNPFHDTYNTTVSIPVFWDPIFLEKKTRFIGAVGERFAAVPAVVLISSSCANATTDDWNVPRTETDVENWLALDYTSAKLIEACTAIIDATMAAFPDRLALMAVGRNGNRLDPDPDYVARSVASSARTAYPDRFVVQKNSLSARTPDPATTTSLGAWQIVFDSQPDVAGQMLWFVTNDPNCRMNGQVTPCDPATMLEQAVTVGVHYGMQYQEIYQRDILNPGLADVIRYAADVLAPPTAPTDLTAIAVSASAVTLSWTPSVDRVGVTGYNVFRDGALIVTTTTSGYQDLELSPWTRYTYEVSAVDATGNESRRTAVSVTTQPPGRQKK
jgi:hypothetical protein